MIPREPWFKEAASTMLNIEHLFALLEHGDIDLEEYKKHMRRVLSGEPSAPGMPLTISTPSKELIATETWVKEKTPIYKEIGDLVEAYERIKTGLFGLHMVSELGAERNNERRDTFFEMLQARFPTPQQYSIFSSPGYYSSPVESGQKLSFFGATGSLHHYNLTEGLAETYLDDALKLFRERDRFLREEAVPAVGRI